MRAEPRSYSLAAVILRLCGLCRKRQQADRPVGRNHLGRSARSVKFTELSTLSAHDLTTFVSRGHAPQLLKRHFLDLADALFGDIEHLADLAQ